MVMKLSTRTAKQLIMKHSKHLKGKSYAISDQLPREMQARRSSQLSELKHHQKTSVPGTPCRLVKDKLIVGNNYIPANFEVNALTPQTGHDYNRTIKSVVRSNIFTEKGSRFQAHAFPISCLDEAMSSLASVIADHPHATHRVYAYQFKHPRTGKLVSGHSDDREWGASKILMDELLKSSQDKFIAVTRYYGGTNLGPKRFEIYKQAARYAANCN